MARIWLVQLVAVPQIILRFVANSAQKGLPLAAGDRGKSPVTLSLIPDSKQHHFLWRKS